MEYIELLGALNTNQIKELVFPKSLRKAQQRLQALSPKLNRVRPCIDSPYIYFYDKPKQLEHVILRNWIYIWLSKKYVISNWQNEVDLGVLRCDALCKLKSPLEDRWAFIEVERDSKNKFDKVEKYNLLYENEGYKGSSLMQRLGNPDIFPKVIIYSAVKRKVSQSPSSFSIPFTLLSPDSLCSIPGYKSSLYADLDNVNHSY